MANLTDKLQPIPPEAFGPGSRITIDRVTHKATLHGANGHTYTELHFTRDDFHRICDRLGIPRPPPDYPPDYRQ